MKIHLCVRRTLDWSDSAGLAERVRPGFRSKLETWNETSEPTYGVFRERLKQIAQLSLSRVEVG